jgi:probable phosphoglycerate mutase
VPIATIHHSPLTRAAQTAEIVARHLPQVPRHCCDLVADRTPVPSAEHRDAYPDRWLPWLDDVPNAERDEDATALNTAVAHFGVVGDNDRHELLITHNFVIGWFVRHVLDAPRWRLIGLNSGARSAAIRIAGRRGLNARNAWSGGKPGCRAGGM